MIESVSVKNYKAFESAHIDIKPITVFLGANNVGKSSMLQLLLLLKQTATLGPSSERCPLRMYGPFVNMGSIENLFHNKNGKLPLEFSISFKNKQLQRKVLFLYKDFVQTVVRIPYLLPLKGLNDLRDEKIDVDDRGSFNRYIRSIFMVLEKNSVEQYKDTLGFLLSRNTKIAFRDINEISVEGFMKTYDYLSALKKALEEGIYTVKYTLGIRKQSLLIIGFSILTSENCILKINAENDAYLKSDFCPFDVEEGQIMSKRFIRNTSVFDCVQCDNQSDQDKTITNYIAYTASLFFDFLKSEFSAESINHVKPLRANPKRYYVIDDEMITPYSPALDGDGVIKILRDNKTIRDSINEWLKRYNLSLKIEKSEDVIHHIKIVQGELELDIPDVGFGISQMLPILVQILYSRKKSVTIVEQPEIHLHPIMQADIADCIRMASTEEKKFVIETHSEYFLRRIRRRVAKGDIPQHQVAIFLFKGKTREKDCTEVSKLVVSETGAFDWPEDYYGGELYNDLVEYIAAQ